MRGPSVTPENLEKSKEVFGGGNSDRGEDNNKGSIIFHSIFLIDWIFHELYEMKNDNKLHKKAFL